MKDFYIPRLYLSGFIRGFDDIAEKYRLERRSYKRGESLTEHGIINNTAHYIRSGLVHLSLTHSSGNLKSLVFFGPETIFPIGVVPHENLIDYEMIMLAMTDVETYSFSYPTLRKLCVENGEFAAKILEENCEMIGYLFYEGMNHAFTPTEIRVCDILYLLLENLKPVNMTISMCQGDMANLIGISAAQLERVLKDLRLMGIIETSRGKIHVTDVNALRSMCSTELRGK